MGWSIAISALLAGCYADPDIRLHVRRPDTETPLQIRVCVDDCKASLNVFEGNAREQLVSLFVDAETPHVIVVLELIAADRCYDVLLDASTRERNVDLAQSEPWSCPTSACEAPLASCPAKLQ